MNIDIQRSNERGTTKTTWLLSRHSFSFGNYLNPQRMNFGALRVLNDDIIEPGTGFPAHHHDNMEIVTIMLEGELHHKDSSGGEGLLKAGEIQAMSAGRGIYHSEFNDSKRKVHLLQIWIDTAEQDIKPRYEQKSARKSMTMPIVGKGKKDGRSGSVSSGLHINQDALFFFGDMEKGEEAQHEIEPGKGAYVFVISGKVGIATHELKEGDAAGITEASGFRMKALEKSEVLVIDVPME